MSTASSPTPRERITCLFCDSTFRDNFNLRRHINSKHPEEANQIMKINCSLCGLIYIRKKDDKPIVEMCNDCKKRTDIEPPESHDFLNENEFKAWKEKTEQETSARFLKSRRTYNLKDGTVKTEFPCYRSSFLSPQNKKLKLKLMSSKKTALCPAKMICEFKPNGEVNVQFFAQHKGHTLDANRVFVKVKKEKVKKVEMPPVSTSASGFSDYSSEQPEVIMPEDYYRSLSNDDYLNNEFNDIDLVLSQIENEGEITSSGKKWLSSFCNAVQNLASNKNPQFSLPFKSSKGNNKKVLRDNNFGQEQTDEGQMSNKMTEEERQSIIQMVLDEL